MRTKNKKYSIKNTIHYSRSKSSARDYGARHKRRAGVLGVTFAFLIFSLVSGSIYALDLLSSDNKQLATHSQQGGELTTDVLADTGEDSNENTDPNQPDDETESASSDTDDQATETPEVESTPTTAAPSIIADSAVAKSSYANPFAGRNIYVGSHDPAGNTANEWQASKPAEAAALRKISGQPIALWLTRGISGLSNYVSSNTANATSQNATPVFVVYGMPGISCSDAAAGASSYITWVESIANAVDNRRVAYIVEPDELAIEQCPGEENHRNAVLKQAVKVLASNTNASIYIDAGHGHWVPAGTMAQRLRDSGIEYAQGFSLNVSNYETTPVNTSYGTTLSGMLGGVHYVVDTSRNGLGPTADNEWCNAPGRALGEKPSVGSGLLDAYLWVKYPGESDLACNGGPSEGQWWPEYAVGLAQRANW